MAEWPFRRVANNSFVQGSRHLPTQGGIVFMLMFMYLGMQAINQSLPRPKREAWWAVLWYLQGGVCV